MSQVQVQVQHPSAALSGSQILNKNQSLLSQPLMSIPSTASSLPSENAGRPIQNSALPSASITSTSAAAGKHMNPSVFCFKCFPSLFSDLINRLQMQGDIIYLQEAEESITTCTSVFPEIEPRLFVWDGQNPQLTGQF